MSNAKSFAEGVREAGGGWRHLAGARRAVWLLLVAVAATFAQPAWAGNYLDRVMLLTRQAKGEAEYLEYRLNNRELAELVQRMAATRLAAARDMSVPKEVTQAHPHLLLMLENYERAADAAADGEARRFVAYQRRARDEELILRGILRQLGFPMPDEQKPAKNRDGA